MKPPSNPLKHPRSAMQRDLIKLDEKPKFRNYAADYLKQNDEDKHLES